MGVDPPILVLKGMCDCVGIEECVFLRWVLEGMHVHFCPCVSSKGCCVPVVSWVCVVLV